MEAFNLEIKNAGPILKNLRALLQNLVVSPGFYLSRLQRTHQINPLIVKQSANALGIHEVILPEMLQLLGIRSLTFNSMPDLAPLVRLSAEMPHAGSDRDRWRYVMSHLVNQEFRSLFRNCRTIAFTDWSVMAGASDLWTGLLTDVIKPIGRKDLEFIFYLGDPQGKLSFQVDEALDIISDFSFYGQVTFALDEREAINLWMVLNGVHQDTPVMDQRYPDLERKYVSIFRTMNISRLLIYSATNAILFTKQEQFVLQRKKVEPTIELAADARQHFIEGFSIGLLLQLDMAHCLALGLIVFGSYGERGDSPAQRDLIAYLDWWAEDNQKPETMYLYQ